MKRCGLSIELSRLFKIFFCEITMKFKSFTTKNQVEFLFDEQMNIEKSSKIQKKKNTQNC